MSTKSVPPNQCRRPNPAVVVPPKGDKLSHVGLPVGLTSRSGTPEPTRTPRARAADAPDRTENPRAHLCGTPLGDPRRKTEAAPDGYQIGTVSARPSLNSSFNVIHGAHRGSPPEELGTPGRGNGVVALIGPLAGHWCRLAPSLAVRKPGRDRMRTTEPSHDHRPC